MRVIVKPFEWIVALFAGPAFLLMLVALVNPRGYSAGLSNGDPPFFFVEGFLFVAGAILELIALIWVAVTWGRSSKATRIFGLAVSALPLLVALMTIALPLHMYRRGLARWATTRVNPVPIRTWYTGGPHPTTEAATFEPYAGAKPIDIADCPPEISMMTPAHVWTAHGDRGVIIQWGEAWEMGSSRRYLFIGIDASEPAPAEIGGWARVAPGMYVSDR